MHLNIAALLAYCGFVVVAAAVAFARARAVTAAGRRRATTVLLLYVIGATGAAGLSQRDLWPLSSWSLMTNAAPTMIGDTSPALRLMAVAADSVEVPVDYRAVEPLPIEELMAWMRINFLALSAGGRDSVGAYLLGRIEAARSRVRAGLPPGEQEGTLGVLRAPFHQLHPKRWTSPNSVPASPFVGLRLYWDRWSLDARAVDSTHVEHTLIYSYQPGHTSP